MKKPLILGLVGLAAAVGGPVGAAQKDDSSRARTEQLTQRNYPVSGFDRVGAIGPIHVVVTVGPATSVRAEGSRKTLDLFEVVVEHGSLDIRPKRDWDGNWREHWRDIEPATFRVTLPRISGAALAGSGDMKVDRVKGERFSAAVAGSGDLDIASLSVEDASFSVAGSGDLVAHGKARQAKVSIAGSGNSHTRDVSSDNASISIVGSGNAALTVKDSARITIMGSGNVNIAGSASCSVTRMGGGRVRCGDFAATDTRH